MKKFLRTACTVTMVVSLASSIMPTAAYATVTNETVSDITKETSTLRKLIQQEREKQKKEADKKEAEYRDGEALVMYYEDASGSKATGTNLFGSSINIEKTWDFSEEDNSKASTKRNVVTGQALRVSKVTSKKLSTKEMISQLQKKKNVVYAEPNYKYHATEEKLTGTYTDYQWGLENKGQNAGTKNCDINVDKVWNKATGTEKVIAVVDSGIDYTHTDLKDNMWENPNQKVLKGEHGYDFINFDADPMDDAGHGSHCAGIIAGSNKGISGVNQQAKLMALKFLDEDGSGDLEGAIGAYDYINRAMKLGVNVVAINNSWGGAGRSDILDKLVNMVGEKGAISVNASGNSYRDMDGNDIDVWATKSEYKISVAASNEQDEKATFSNYGKESVDLAAPGTDILSSVCYNQYNPTIHAGDKKYSELFVDFNQSFDYSEIKTFNTSDNGKIEVKPFKGLNFGLNNQTGSCLAIEVDAKEVGQYGIYVPLTLPKSSTNYYIGASLRTECKDVDEDAWDTAYVSFGIDKLKKLKNIQMDGIHSMNLLNEFYIEPESNYWETFATDTGITSSSGTEDGIWVCVDVWATGKYTVYLDNVGFSKKNMEPSQFGKYDFYNGTSMAAPYVTGAVGLLGSANPDLSAKELRDMVTSSVRKTEELQECTKSGGVLDLSQSENIAPILKDIKTTKETIQINGTFFGDQAGDMSVNGKKATILEWSKNKIIIDTNGLMNKNVTFQIKTADGKEAEKQFYTSYNELEIETLGEFDQVYGGIVGTDEKNLYYINADGSFFRYSEDKWEQRDTLKASVIDSDSDEEVSGALGIYPMLSSQLVYADGSFYAIASYDVGYYCGKALVKYNIEEDKWSNVKELSSNLANVEESTLAAYQGKLYILGGYDIDKKEVVGTVFTYDYKNPDATLVKEEMTIPSRFAGLAQVVNDKLVLTLGGDGTDKCPANIIFDGTEWKVDEDSKIETDTMSYYYCDDNEVPYFNAQIGKYKDQIIYTNLVTDNLGDVFIYNVQDNSFETVPCSVYEYTKDADSFLGTTVGDQFMMLTANIISIFDEDEWEYSITSEGKLLAFNLNEIENN